jgi:phosphotransferase system  glucose/maltose/N-acetylglucosamine-specific IIC component
MQIPEFDTRTFVVAALLVFGGALIFSGALVGFVLWRVRKIQLPANADFFTTLRATPLIVVLTLDLLDFTLDFLSAPVAWVLLTRLGLGPLRGVTMVEGLIPGTQIIPTMTLTWIASRLFKEERLL